MTPNIQLLRNTICEKVFIKNSEKQIGIMEDPNAWIFDFRRVLMNGVTADLVSEIFYETFSHKYPFQLCALEIAGVPLVTSCMTKFYHKGHTDINAFFIRKSRKKTGLMQMIEGEIQDEKKIILVDDTINSGNSFWRQVEILEELGYRVDTVWSIIRYRDLEYYKRFENRGINVESVFTLNEFTNDLGDNVSNRVNSSVPTPMPFSPNWIFKSDKPSYNWVTSKSQPVLDEENIYFGSDNGTLWALKQSDGSVAWQFQVGPGSQKKSIFSSPALYNSSVIFGAYDGNIYALDAATGKRKWVNFDADWVGSSPAVAHDLRMVFIGMEFGLLKKLGGIVALDASTGKKIWADYSHPAFTHSSPLYLKDTKEVVIGSNDGVVRMYTAKSGEKQWEFTTFGGATYEETTDGGFSEGDIKEGFAHDIRNDFLIFGATDGFLYILERKTGHLVHHFKCLFGIYSTPIIYKNRVYFTSVDKHIRCIDLETKKLLFEKKLDGTRIFSSPTIINNKLYVGTNAARLHELDPETGDTLGYFQTRERITNTIVYNQKTNTFFLPTYANEIIELKRDAE